MTTCPKCFGHVPPNSPFCPVCGVALTIDGRLAPTPEGASEAPSPAQPPRPHPHPHHHHEGPAPTIAPLTGETNWMARLGGGLVGVFVIAVAVWGYTRWKHSSGPPMATWASPPLALPGMPSGGASHTCMITEAGTVMCWGDSQLGQLGDTVGAPAGAPCAVCTQGNFTQLDAGDNHTCARSSEGRIVCWGSNLRSQLGTPTTTECVTTRGRVPCSVIPVGGPVEQVTMVASGADFSCALGNDSTVTCWGADYRGQLGVASLAPGQIAARPAGDPRYAAIVAGAYHACGIRSDGRMECWGWNSSGQLGTSRPTPQCGPTVQTRTPCSPRPVAVDTDVRFSSAVGGGEHTCALEDGGRAWCWGSNRVGQLGTGGTTASPTPVSVSGYLRFSALAAGNEFSCGIAADSTAWCWGASSSGQLGTGDSTMSALPVRVILPAPALAIGAGTNHVCTVIEGSRVFCWGAGRAGQLGTLRRLDSRTPVEAGLEGGVPGGEH